MTKDRISLEELYYVLMSSWIYSIEKTRAELLGENIAYTKRIGWNATEYITKKIKDRCEIDMEPVGETPFETLKSIIRCLEDVQFIKKGTITVKEDKNTLSIEITNCGAEACKELIKKGVKPQVCLRSIILSALLESFTDREYVYKLYADPENQPSGICITRLSELE